MDITCNLFVILGNDNLVAMTYPFLLKMRYDKCEKAIAFFKMDIAIILNNRQCI